MSKRLPKGFCASVKDQPEYNKVSKSPFDSIPFVFSKEVLEGKKNSCYIA